MASSWRHPGRTGAVLYAVAAALVSGLVAVFGRLQLARQHGRRRVADRLPDGGLIVISNHTSHADGLLLAIACRRMGRSLRMLTTAGVFRVPIIGSIARRLGFIPVERGSLTASAALAPAAEAIAAGEAVGIFPEGHLTRDPAQWPERAKTGAVRLALMTGAPVVPVAMVGAHRLLGRQRRLGRLVMNVVVRPRVEVAVGQPIDVGGWGLDPADSEQIRRATDEVMTQLIDLIEELRQETAPAAAGVDPEEPSSPDRA